MSAAGPSNQIAGFVFPSRIADHDDLSHDGREGIVPELPSLPVTPVPAKPETGGQ